MNKRIIELARLSGGIDMTSHSAGDIDITTWIGTGTPEFLKRFAELIIKDCAGIYSKIDNGNSHMGTDDYLEALRKTFRS